MSSEATDIVLDPSTSVARASHIKFSGQFKNSFGGYVHTKDFHIKSGVKLNLFALDASSSNRLDLLPLSSIFDVMLARKRMAKSLIVGKRNPP